MKKVLVTGSAGFIGHHLATLLHANGMEVIGLDQLNDYYDVNLKLSRLQSQGINIDEIEYGKLIGDEIKFIKLDLEDDHAILQLFKEQKFDYVINLAAQAGVRYSLENPKVYIGSNVYGFLSILEACRAVPVEHLVYASTSSVYGLSKQIPFNTEQCTDHPMALYAATKKSNEVMAHSYSHLFNIPTTGLRFFTVYGPYGRPDMALFLFTKAMLEGKPIDVFGEGKMSRDFTYVGDIVKAISLLLPKPPQANPEFDATQPTPNKSSAPYSIYNIGYNSPVGLMDYISEVEKNLGITADKNYMPMQPGDVRETYADVSALYSYIDFKPQVGIEEGVKNFIDWYKEYYNIE
ncbi:NAD-dependent epimerase [bacterium]|nr:NAD-dependent epimerase [bacterium]